MSIARNDLCHCGSGKKYKKCCLNLPENTHQDLRKRRWSSIQVGLVDKILKHAYKVYGPEAIEFAYDEFNFFENESGFDPDSKELSIFMPWFFYEWYPLADEEDLFEEAPEIPPAQSLYETGKGLSQDERSYLLECCKTSFSYYEVLEIEIDISLKLKDILTEDEYLVLEQKATYGLNIGDILFGKVITIDGINILEACAPIVFKPISKLEVLDLKQFINEKNKFIDHNVLHDYSVEILELYRELFDRHVNPPKPILQNTDGHLLIPHKMIFDIEDANKTFEALYPLCFNETREEILSQAKFNANGSIKEIEFPWLIKGNKKNKSWDNTIMGRIHIEENKMTVDVNSQERAKKFQTLLKKSLPFGWILKATMIDSLEAQLKESKLSAKDALVTPNESEDLINRPEVREQIEMMFKAHWDSWVSQPVPALGGLTPKQCVKTPVGREKVEALLAQFEQDMITRPIPGQSMQNIQDVRKKLGI